MTRSIIDQNTSPIPNGAQLAENYAGHFGRLLSAASFAITNTGGTGNAVTGRIDAQFHNVGLTYGQKVQWIQPATNASDNVEITLTPYDMDADPVVPNGSAVTYSVLSATGAAITSGEMPAGSVITAFFDSSNLRVTNGLDGSGASTAQAWIFESTQTWTQPLGRSDDELLRVIMWGGGGPGAQGSSNNTVTGGGGGQCMIWEFRLGDIPNSILATVGAGATTPFTTGGSSTFGSLLSAAGGGPGRLSSGYVNELGGSGGAFGDDAEPFSGGDGGRGITTGTSADPARDGASRLFGAAGGGAVQGSFPGLGGVSMVGGNGGAAANGQAEAGQAPGGGGGGGSTPGAGARGEIRAFLR